MLAHSFDTIIGRLTAVESDGRLIMLSFGELPDIDVGKTPLLLETERQIREYFDGRGSSSTFPRTYNATASGRTLWKR